MILVRRLNGEEIILNAELIETVEQCPDTLISLTTGKKFLVLDHWEEIVNKVVEYRQRVYSSAPVRALHDQVSQENPIICDES